MVPVYQTSQIRELERLAKERFNITGEMMMQRAGKSAFDCLLRHWPSAKKIGVICGAGNNGGDGYVLAKLAHDIGFEVTVWQTGKMDQLKNEARIAYEHCKSAGVPIQSFDPQLPLHNKDVLVDALLGIGLHGELAEETAVVIQAMNDSGIPILSLDLPSGVDANVGAVVSTAVKATVTITFIGLKIGLLTGYGIACTGELIVDDLLLPAELYTLVVPMAERISRVQFFPYLKPRTRDWHKGKSGHVLIVGGEYGYSGAALMAAEAALRVGAGLVSIATRLDHASLLNVTFPEIMCHAVESKNELYPLMKKADVIVVGPGLGVSIWGKKMWQAVLETNLPLIVDGDALNLLAENSSSMRDNWILTPHPGEAARLLKKSVIEVQQDRLTAVMALQKNYQGVAVLKGAGTFVLAANSLPAVCDKGNPGMATAGMGDVLSGVIGGLVAQHLPLDIAAKLGVAVHGQAGDMAAKEGERGLIATDLLVHLRHLVNP